jgi:hypothetical protein
MSTPTTTLAPTLYTYTLDQPSTDPAENKRLGYRTPRSILLPPYLAQNSYFTEFMDAIDYVFDSMVDQPTDVIGDLRNMWVTNPTLENAQITEAQLIPFSAWSQPEWAILVQQTNGLGMNLESAGAISNDSYQAIARWVGMYWFGKGTQSFIDFINYSLSSSLQLVPLWTEDYVNFVAEGDTSIGTPIWEGGTWYPTTQVSIIAAGGLQSLDIVTLVTFFYEIANYNLVLNNIALTYNMNISTSVLGTTAPVVDVGLYMVQTVPISNLYSYGAAAPTLSDTGEIPTLAYTTNPEAPSITGTYMFGAPTSWLQDTSNRLWPLYDTPQQATTLLTEIPTVLCGPVVPGATAVIYGPPQWQAVPTGTYSNGRVPVFSSVPVPGEVVKSEVTANIIGYDTYLLVNPSGFAEFVPGSGLYAPYWTGSQITELELQSGGNLLLNDGSILTFVGNPI